MRANISKGFTLIEVVVGLVVIAIVTLVITVGMGSVFRQTEDPWQQVRAAELGQSLMNEIMSRKFDEMNTSTLRCSMDSEPCTNPLPPSEASCPAVGEDLPNVDPIDPDTPTILETRSEFDDVDDFNCLGITLTGLNNVFGNNIELDFYRGFSAEVRVFNVTDDKLKQIDVVIITPQDERIKFSAQRGNW
ncbi:type II secretion system GspH family protein [Idiomarina sp. M1R2S28]|uniref:Type II secretion system GspH family protein n=1 Tax=Idiomarina rhizosphaerae TaxID=2961572 RepID=A0A9X2FUA6_9GAMM|nr:type II secretion system protein [Idiomarina rhizosphaerae]MCP1338717.1 type II secretion system GspH family protein [Idiomarina rhizosphaerae]